MLKLGTTSLNLIATAMIATGIILSMLPMILPQLSQREDILLALVVLASGIILLLQGRYVSESVQFLLILLLLPTLCYTIEIIWLRKRIKR